MLEIILLVFLFLFAIFSCREKYTPLFSAHFYPKMQEVDYHQMSRLPYNMEPVGPYTLGWEERLRLNELYPTQPEVLHFLYPP